MVKMMRKSLLLSLLLLLPLLKACSSGPTFDSDKIATTLTPQQAVAEAEQQRGKEVLWGGMIIHSTNLPDGSRLEVLAYPLDGKQAPRMNQPPLGRFLLHHPDYLETIDYAPGRRITVHGRLLSIEEGMVDKSPYRFPLVEAQQLHLWPRGEPSQPRVHFGIGVVFGR